VKVKTREEWVRGRMDTKTDLIESVDRVDEAAEDVLSEAAGDESHQHNRHLLNHCQM